MKYNMHQNHYRLTVENEDDEKFLQFLDSVFENCSSEKGCYWRPVLTQASMIGKDNEKKYIDFEISSLNFKIADTIKLEVIVDDTRGNPVTSELFLTPSKKRD
ncbi:MAG: hypothetical protein Q7S33_03220 [Nanoarchaeota archaeon]|nr:hypothetical protein [Nanoarchaeota archaeon]